MNLIASIVARMSRSLRTVIGQRATFGASPVSDRNVTQGIDWNAVYRDRYNYQRDTVLSESLLAWRLNPLARRLVTLTRTYVADTVGFSCTHEGTNKFLKELWTHPLNGLASRLGEWSRRTQHHRQSLPRPHIRQRGNVIRPRLPH